MEQESKLKMMNDSILIKLDEDSNKTVSGILYKPDGACEHVLRTAEVLGVGPGKYVAKADVRDKIDLKEGDGVLFIKFVTYTNTSQEIQQVIGKDKAIIRPADVLLVYNRDDPPQFS